MTINERTKAAPTLGYGDYLRFSHLVGELYGLNFPEKRRADLEQGIRLAFAGSSCQDLDSYYHLLLDPANSPIHRQRLVNALTVGESHFFRDTGQFNALYSHVLPEIIERRRPLRTLRIWSAGCAEGQEPYSLAMMLRELLPDADEWAITILGTDINTSALERALRGVYSEWAFREPRSHDWRERYFRDLGGKRYELLPRIRRMVTFAQLNLAEAVYPAFQTNTTFLDLIICRNVTIYLSAELTRTVVQRFYDGLVDGGWLVVGHSEHSVVTYQQFQAQSFPDAILYQRTGRPTQLPEDWTWFPSLPKAEPAPEPLPVVPEAEPRHGFDGIDLSPEPEPAVDSPPAEREPVSDGPDPLTLAQELLEYGRTEEAQELMVALLDTDPRNAKAALVLGQSYANQGVWQEAQRWCQHAIQLDSLQPEPYYIQALVYQHQGLLAEALDSMRKAVYLDSGSVHGQYGLANLHHSLQQLPQALKALDNARRLLMGLTDSEILPQTGGITVGAMRQAVTQQLQQWSAEAVGTHTGTTKGWRY